MSASDSPSPSNQPSSSSTQAEASGDILTPANLDEALHRIDEILARLEEGTQPLEVLLKDYETGVRLLRVCQERLSAAERRIMEVTRQLDGSLALNPFDAPQAPPEA